MDSLPVGPGTQVTLNFSLTLEDDSVVDSNFDSDPVTFTIGDGSMLPGFEKAMFGLSSGEEGCFEITPENGFGERNPSNVQEVDRSEFPADITLEKGLMLSFSDAASQERPGVIFDMTDEVVTIDFNHPLSGRNIQFNVRIVDVTPDVTH